MKLKVIKDLVKELDSKEKLEFNNKLCLLDINNGLINIYLSVLNHEFDFESFKNNPDYQENYINYLNELINAVLITDEKIFTTVLKYYNSLLAAKRTNDEKITPMIKKYSSYIPILEKEKKLMLIIAAVLAGIFPEHIIVIITVALLQILNKSISIATYKIAIEKANSFFEGVDSCIDTSYPIVDNIRTHYHQNKTKLEELKQDIIKNPNKFLNNPELVLSIKEIVNPLNYSMIDTDQNKVLITTAKEEKQKKLTLKKD